MSRATRLVAAALLAAAPAAGCGGDAEEGQTYTAASFVAAANEHGAGLELGSELPFSGADALEAREISFEETGTEGDAGEHAHGTGTISIFASDAEAVTEYERCEAAILTCFRAANVAIAFFADVEAVDVERLGAALRALAGEM